MTGAKSQMYSFTCKDTESLLSLDVCWAPNIRSGPTVFYLFTEFPQFETGSMTGILGQLKWESLKKRRKDSRLILLYKGLKGKARIPTDDLIPKNRRCRNQHSLAFQIPSASKEAYKSSFFPQTIRDWNDLPDSLISSAEMSDDCVSKFASLLRARD